MSVFSITASIGGTELLCTSAEIRREAATTETVTVSNGVLTRKRGAGQRFITLVGSVLSDDYSTLQETLEDGLTTDVEVLINETEIEGAEIVGYRLSLKEGEELGEIRVELFA